MGIELDDNAPWPRLADGQSVPHKVEVAEVAELWAAGQRRARLILRLERFAFVAFLILVSLMIVVSGVKHT